MRLCVLAIVCTAGLLRADTYPRQNGVDIEHYRFAVELSDALDEIRGETRVDVRFLAGGVSAFELDLAMGMTVDGVIGYPFTHSDGRLRIRFDTPPRAGELRRIEIRYHGTPAAGLRIGTNLHGDRTFASQNWPNLAHHWLPVIDHPYDKATSEFLITAPVRYQVIANGGLQEERDLGDGRRMTHWKESVPIAVWLNAVSAAQFSVRHFGQVNGIPLSNWVYPQDREASIATFDAPTKNAIAFLTQFIGPYPYEKLANVQVAGFQGGMEHASNIFYGEKVVNGKPAANLVAHEIAHQWFGNSITENDWDDVWLSEGFATYFSLLTTEHVEGRDSFVEGLRKSRTQIKTLEATLPDTAILHRNLDDMKKVLNRLIYQKGAWTLHMLRGLLGRETFRAAIRDYYRQYQGRNATTADFQRVMEEHGNRELGWFFDQWLRRPGTPELEGSWDYDAATGHVKIELRQTQPGEPYRLPIAIAVEPGRIEQVELATREAVFSFSVKGDPGTVIIDPDTWLLATVSFQRK